MFMQVLVGLFSRTFHKTLLLLILSLITFCFEEPSLMAALNFKLACHGYIAPYTNKITQFYRGLIYVILSAVLIVFMKWEAVFLSLPNIIVGVIYLIGGVTVLKCLS